MIAYNLDHAYFMSKEKPFLKTEIQLLMRMRCKECPCAHSNGSHCLRRGTSSQGAAPVSSPFSSQGQSTNCAHRLLCRYIHCTHFQSSNQRLGFAFCPIILIFSEMGTIDPLCFTLIQTLYC